MKLSNALTMAAMIAAGTLTATVAARAQDASHIPPATVKPPGGGRVGGANAERIATQLGLTDEQKEKIRPILMDRVHQMADVRNDTTLDKPAKAAKYKEIVEETNNKLKEVLTPDQFAKWQSLSVANRRPPGRIGATAVTPTPAPAPGGTTAPTGDNKPQQ